MELKYYNDDNFFYVKIKDTKYKGNYLFIPRAMTFIKIKYIEFKNFNYELEEMKITKNIEIFKELFYGLEEYIEKKKDYEEDKERFYDALSGYPY